MTDRDRKLLTKISTLEGEIKLFQDFLWVEPAGSEEHKSAVSYLEYAQRKLERLKTLAD